FKQSFNQIREAIFVVRQWVAKPPNGAKRTLLGRMLIRLLIETTHHMGITTLMKDPHTQPMVLRCLEDMLALPPVDLAQFADFIYKHTGPLRQQFEADQHHWNVREDAPRSNELRESLLRDQRWKDVYAISSSDLTLQQSQQLQNYIAMLDSEICPS